MLAGTSEQTAIYEGLHWLGVMVITAMLAFSVAVSVRRKTKAAAAKPAPEFTLDQLRDLRDRGELTISQYEALKQEGNGRFERLRSLTKRRLRPIM